MTDHPGGFPADGCVSVRDGRLFIEEIPAEELAHRFGTPIYVESERQLRSNARRFTRALEEGWPEGPVRVLPSIKANYSLALRCILTEEGMGCDTFGAGELDAAIRCGVTPDLISVNGSMKDLDLIRRAVEVGAKITLDSERELDVVFEAAQQLDRRPRIRLRVRPSYSALDEPTDFAEDLLPIKEAADAYKAGIPMSDIKTLGRRALGSDRVEVTGLMAHLGRHRADLGVWRKMVAAFVETVAELSAEWGGWLPRELDLGGGFATQRDPTGRLLPRLEGRPAGAPSIERYCAAITGAIRSEMTRVGLPIDGLAIEVEPGRSLYADTGVHLTTVKNIKRQAGASTRCWVETDTTEMFLLDSLIEHNRWTPVACGRADAVPTQTLDLVGKSCGFDVIVPSVAMPDLEEGDVIAILDTGAYADATSTNFNALPRPATVLVSGQTAEVIKRAEDLEDVFRREIVPARLVKTEGASDG